MAKRLTRDSLRNLSQGVCEIPLPTIVAGGGYAGPPGPPGPQGEPGPPGPGSDSMCIVPSSGFEACEQMNTILDNEATGSHALALGEGTLASGRNSVSEGNLTVAEGENSHAEGFLTEANGVASHTEGVLTIAGDVSHAEGDSTAATGYASHSEGIATTASGNNSHAEGNFTQALGIASHSEGQTTVASGDYSHAEGNDTQAIGDFSHSENWKTRAEADYSTATGIRSLSYHLGEYSRGGQGFITDLLGESQYMNVVMQFDANNGAGPLTLGEGSLPLVPLTMPADAAWTVEVKAVAKNYTTGETKHWVIEFGANNQAGAVTICPIDSRECGDLGTALWTLTPTGVPGAVQLDFSNGILAGENIRVVAKVEIVQVLNGII